MKAQVIYLNRWLNCPDEILRSNYLMQQKISEGRINFWYQMNELKINNYQAQLCYDRWVHSNRDRIHIVIDESTQQVRNFTN